MYAKEKNRKTLIVLAVLTVLMANSITASASWYTITNPVFYEGIDSQGGAWDGFKWYARESVDLLSGSWRANLRIGSNQAWIDQNYFNTITPDLTTPCEVGDLSCYGGVRSVISTLENSASAPYGLGAGTINVVMNATMVPETTYLGLRGNNYVVSEPWVMKQSYTITNNGTTTLSDVAFYMYYFPSPYGTYPTNARPSHVDYTAGIADPMGYTYDITLYGEGDGNWAHTGLSTNIPPTAHDVGHGGGYPDPPYYSPSSYRPSAISTDVLRQVEANTLRNWDSYDAPFGTDPVAVAGAFKWNIGSLAPGASYTITFLESVAPHIAGTTTNSISYSALVTTGQNTYVEASNGSFGLLLKGQTKTINNSVVLNNTGDIPAKVEARFNDSNSIGGVYGLISGFNVLNASSFALGIPGALVPLSSSGFDVQVTIAPPGVTMMDARLSVPSDQPSGDYSGTVVLTFSNNI